MAGEIYTVNGVDAEIKAQFQAVFKGEQGKEITKLMQARLLAKNITQATEHIVDAGAAEEDATYCQMLKDSGLYEYYLKSLAVNPLLTSKQYFESNSKLGLSIPKVSE